MKKTLLAAILVLGLPQPGPSQTVNWRSLRDVQKHVVQLSFGYDYGVTAQLRYGRSVDLGAPAMVTIDYSFPMGANIFDDFTIRLGGEIEVLEVNGFSTSVRIMSTLRRFENDLVSIVSAGADAAVTAGYYSPAWHAAAEVGYDTFIMTRLEHSDIMRRYFPAIRDGWYSPTGGQYSYGIRSGLALGESVDLCLRIGATAAQAGDRDAVLPYYLQVGLGTRF